MAFHVRALARPTAAAPKADVLARWKAGMTQLAADCPNVCVKVGGLEMTWCIRIWSLNH